MSIEGCEPEICLLSQLGGGSGRGLVVFFGGGGGGFGAGTPVIVVPGIDVGIALEVVVIGADVDTAIVLEVFDVALDETEGIKVVVLDETGVWLNNVVLDAVLLVIVSLDV